MVYHNSFLYFRINLIKKYNGNASIPIALVGNNIYLNARREVSYEEGKKNASENCLIYFETPADENNGINEFQSIAT